MATENRDRSDAKNDAVRDSVLSPEEIARYSRHIMLPQVGLEGQEKITRARILVIGMGGLGSPASLYLAAAGVGTLGLADFDVVEAHNLQRQIIHRDDSVGKPKIRSAERQLEALNPNVRLREHADGITVENALSIFSDYDVIVDGSDNFPTRYLSNDAAFFAKIPLVYGSIFQFEGQVAVFHPTAGSPCYRCLFAQMPEPGSVPNCEEAGVFGALCGVIGSMQALEAIKLILGIGDPSTGRFFLADTLGMHFRTLNIRKDPGCPLCGNDPVITELRSENYDYSCAPGEQSVAEKAESSVSAIPLEVDVSTARDLLDASPEAFLLDVREPYEVAICEIDGGENIPMRQLPDRVDSLPHDRPIVVYCHTGIRSLNVAKFLHAKGWENATSMAGGISEWARQFDPDMAQY